MTAPTDVDPTPTETESFVPLQDRLAARWRRFARSVSDDPGRLAEAAVSLVVVVLGTALVAGTVDLRLLFLDTTPTGGDMGAHVWGPDYLLRELLPNLRLSGWTHDWYAGFPAYQFYMVVPSLLIVILHVGLPPWASVLVVAAAAASVLAAWSRPQLYRFRRPILVMALIVTVLSISVPYNISFKVISAIGLLGMPIACWAFAKLADLPFPIPPIASAAGLVFLYNREPLYNNTGNIIGGNFHSTMAGEFAFSISLTISILYLGVAVRGLRTGRHRALAAVLFALAGLCHLIPAFFVLACTGALFLLHPDRGRFRWLATMMPVAGLLSAFWVVPFWWRRDYVNDMGWERLPLPNANDSIAAQRLAGDQESVLYYLFPPGLRYLMIAAAVGVVISVVRRYRVGLVLGIAWLAVAIAFWQMPQYRLWNARLLPFMYLSVSLLAAIAAGELLRVAETVASGSPRRRFRPVTVPSALAVGLGTLLYVALPVQGVAEGTVGVGSFHIAGIERSPVERETIGDDGKPSTETVTESTFEIFGIPFRTRAQNGVAGWAEWNYRGLQQKEQTCTGEPETCTRGWPEYRDFMQTMVDLGEDPRYGCGRAFWEYENDRINSYGTPMAPMLLPYWSGGCIASMEGLYFESTPTVPVHFLMQSQLSASPSRPQRDLPYPAFDIDAGVRNLQLLGVRYYVALSDTAIAAAADHPDLTEIAVTGPWHVYLVADSVEVAPLAYEPVVAEGLGESQDEFLPIGSAWLLEGDLEVPLAVHGPDDWARVEAEPVPTELRHLTRWVLEQSGRSGPMDQVPDQPRTPLPEIEVTDVEHSSSTISFDVSRPGVPVLVKTSYFPNWVVEGGEGPYRVTPNLMVVVPTDEHVEMRFARTPPDVAALVMSAIGLIGLVGLARARPIEVDPLDEGRLSRRIDRWLTLPEDRPDLSDVPDDAEDADDADTGYGTDWNDRDGNDRDGNGEHRAERTEDEAP